MAIFFVFNYAATTLVRASSNSDNSEELENCYERDKNLNTDKHENLPVNSYNEEVSPSSVTGAIALFVGTLLVGWMITAETGKSPGARAADAYRWIKDKAITALHMNETSVE